MKAQRRHELQQSDLAKVIKKAPGFWQQSAGWYLGLAIVVVVAAILIRYRITSGRQGMATALDDLAQARLMVEQTERLAMRSSLMPAGQANFMRKQLYNDAIGAINEATSRSDDRQIAAEALLVKGDLNWALAMIPELAGASTQPTLQFKDPKELLAAASEAYQSIVSSYADVKHASVAARFGLAAIAENKGDFDAAKQQYETIAQQTNDIGAYQQLASERLRLLADLRRPVILAKAATEPVEPSPTTAAAVPPLIAAPTPATTQSAAKGQANVTPPATTQAAP